MMLRITTRQSCQGYMVDILRQYVWNHLIDPSNRPKSSEYKWYITMFALDIIKTNKGCWLLSLAWPADCSGRVIPDLPSTRTRGRSSVLSMAMYSVADINHDSTTRIPSSTSWQTRCLIQRVVSKMSYLFLSFINYLSNSWYLVHKHWHKTITGIYWSHNCKFCKNV